MVPCSPPEEGTVAVMVRVRPLAPCERERPMHPVLHVVDQHVIVLNPEEPGGPAGSVLPVRGPKHQGKDLKFVFDRVFGEEATQEEVFQHTTSEVLDSVLDGYNCSVFAYGATGAGKTYTMLGSERSPGIMYFTMVELYKRMEARKQEKSCEVLVSYQEVYNEQIYDLLEPKGPLAIREDPERGVVVQGLSFHQPASAEQLLEMLANGNKNRTQHPTDANAASSRSHAIFQIHVKQQDCIGSLTRGLKVGKMSLIDLAGSERASVANTRGERLREGANINRSLLALINVINALADAKSKKSHIPYRDSKLTRLLKDSIGGNCRTVILAAVSPSVLAYEDTYNTLKYASRAKEIKMSLKSNTRSSDYHTCEYVEICEQLKGEVADLRAKLRAYEDAAREAENQVPVPEAPSSLSPVELPRLEEAVPKTCLALDDQRENDELAAGLPVQMQLELKDEAPEEMPSSSPRASHQADLQLNLKQPRLGRNSLLQGLSGHCTEKSAATVLSGIQKLYSILKAANLLTPDVVSVLEELEHLAPQDTGVSPEQAVSLNRSVEISEATPAKRMKWSDDAEASVTMYSTPVASATLQCLQQPAPFSSHVPMPSSPIKKRKPKPNGASPSGPSCGVKRQMKHQQRSGKAEEIPRTQSPSTPWLEAEAPASPGSPVSPCYSPQTCPAPATKSRVPLVTSAAQNHCSLPAHDLNVTFEVCEDRSPSAIEPISINLNEVAKWESSQHLQKKQESLFGPKAPILALAMKSSCIPKPSVLKRKRVESIAVPCVGELQRGTAQLQSSSKSCVQPSRIPGCHLGPSTRKGNKRTHKALAPVPPAPTPQPMKLLR